MNNLIKDILNVSNYTLKDSKFTLVDLNKVLQTALQNLDLQIKASEIMVRYQDLDFVVANEIQLTRLFQNLISNAIKFRDSSKMSYLHIVLNSCKNYHTLSFNDNGIGFDKAKAKFIFEEFKRLNDNGNSDGHGIGLATCKRIIDFHQGKIWFDSIEGIGSTFYVQIPKKIKKQNTDPNYVDGILINATA